ncbi:uncharacterized protein LOC135490763 isoform X2 [Lineus longissimus]
MPTDGSPEEKGDKLIKDKPNRKESLLSNRANKPQLTPEEQELAYELKAQMMRTIEVQNTKLKTELALHDKMQELRVTTPSHRNRIDECNLSRTNLVKLMRLYEKRANEATNNVVDLKQELQKSQFMTQKFQSLYESEKRKNSSPGQKTLFSKGDEQNEISHTCTDSETASTQGSRMRRPFTPMMRPQSMAGFRFDDFQRKSEYLIMENENLKQEIIRLKNDNARLIQQTKHAESDRATMCHQIITRDMSRKQLVNKLEKERKEHRQLNKSLTRQAADWLQQKKMAQQLEEEMRWNQVGPVAVLGAEGRTYSHKVTKNVYQPHMMMPVEKYAGTTSSHF